MSLRGRFPRLLRGGSRWRWGNVAVATLSVFALANLCLGAAILAIHLGLRDAVVHAPVLNMLLLGLIASAAGAYTLVSSRAARSSQLHLHGLAIFIMLVTQVAFNAKQAITLEYGVNTRRGLLLVVILNWLLWWMMKVLLILLMTQKMIALGPSAGCCAKAQFWSRALLTATLLCGTASIGVPATSWILFADHDITFSDVLEALSFKVADLPMVANTAFWLFSFCFITGSVSIFIAGGGMLQSACRLTYRATSKLRERKVEPDQLAEVRRKLSQHLLGIFMSILSTLLVLALGLFPDAIDLFGEGWEDIIGGVVVTLDVLGDTMGILFLSGIGSLLFNEDPDAGDVSGHIRGLLQAAVLTSRAPTLFEGRVIATESGRCIVSFPGKYMMEWNALTWACEQGDLSSACVFLPSSDPKGRYGEHVSRMERPDTCWCTAIYGEVKPWGCRWFHDWQENLRRAVELGLELVVVFFPNEAGRGIVPWDALPRSNLWDGVGLGGSQKAEVAFLCREGLPVSYEDLEAFRSRMKSRRR